MLPQHTILFGCHYMTGSPGSADPMLEAIIQEKLKGISREASDRNDKYRKCKQMLMVGDIFLYLINDHMSPKYQKRQDN